MAAAAPRSLLTEVQMKLDHVVRILASLALAATVTSAAPAAKRDAAPVAADGWPETHEGAAGREDVKAVNGGDDAMKAYDVRWSTPASLARRPPEKRLGRYHELRESYGTLAFASIVEQKPGELVVRLLDADAASHEFVFTLETGAPYRVRQVSMRQMQTVPHGLGGVHH